MPSPRSRRRNVHHGATRQGVAVAAGGGRARGARAGSSDDDSRDGGRGGGAARPSEPDSDSGDGSAYRPEQSSDEDDRSAGARVAARAASSRRLGRHAAAARRSGSDSDSGDGSAYHPERGSNEDDDENEDDDDDDSHSPPPRQRTVATRSRGPKRRAAPPPRGRRAAPHSDDACSFGTAEWDDSSRSSSSSDDDDDDDKARPRKAPPPRLQKAQRQKAQQRKASPRKTLLRKAIVPKFLRRRAASEDDSDEEFQANDSDEDDEDDYVADDALRDSDSEASDDEYKDKKTIKIGQVHDDEIGTAGESSDDEPPPRKSPRLSFDETIEPRLKSSHDGDSSGADESPRPTASTPKLVFCPSRVDAITLETLPRRHICYVTPDGKSRQCFCLATLRKIALTTNRPVFGPNGRRTFLQPPHFRSVVSADIVDQIASLFGREALDIDGPYYQRRAVEAANGSDGSGEDGEDSDDDVGEDFVDAVNRYVVSTMGSRDLYCCPLCYTVAFNRVRVRKTPQSESLPIEEKYSTDFTIDPLSVLLSLDGGQLQVASACCFPHVAKLKRHLREDHGVDTSVIEGNALYERFQVRKQDGLLQRWIAHVPVRYRSLRGGHGRGSQGGLLAYWHEDGHHLDFVYLLGQVDLAEEYRALAPGPRDSDSSDSDGSDFGSSPRGKALVFMRPSHRFWDSFNTDAPELWEYLAGPYMAVEDMDDFLASGSEEEASDDSRLPAKGRRRRQSAQAAYRDLELRAQQQELDAEAAVAAHYEELSRAEARRHRRRRSGGIYASDEESEAEEGAGSDDASSDYGGGPGSNDDALQESDEEEEDPWIAAKQAKLQGTIQKRLAAKNSRRTSRTSRASLSPAEGSEAPSPARKRRRTIDLGDDDEE